MKKMMEEIHNWLSFIENWPLVCGYEWTKHAKAAWIKVLQQRGIQACFDRVDNILLGANTEEKWYQQVLSKQNKQRFILQAHLDHPGGVVLAKIFENERVKRYGAVIQGGLLRDLRGRLVDVYDSAGNQQDQVLIDNIHRNSEYNITFKTNTDLKLPAYLVPPSFNDASKKEKMFFGWGLDDHLGCAIILAWLQQQENPNACALLTWGEETVGSGIKQVIQQIQTRSGLFHVPVLVNIEVTAEDKEQDHRMGKGACWRVEEKRTKMDERLLKKIRCGKGKKRSLKSGECEAGLWARAGGRSLCIAIPCLYVHNGVRVGEWRGEEVQKKDVLDAVAMIDELTRRRKKFFRCTGPRITKKAGGKYRIHDYTKVLRKKTRSSEDYQGCLKEMLPYWNTVHDRFDQPQIKFPQEYWKDVRDQILQTEAIAREVKSRLPICVKNTLKWLGVKKLKAKSPNVHFFVKASFNAANMNGGIGLSLEKIKTGDVDRILIHELAHYYTTELLDNQEIRSPYRNLLSEGIACLAGMEILGLSEQQTLGLTKEQHESLVINQKEISQLMQKHFNADVWDVSVGRHEIVRRAELAPPFKYTSDHQAYLKYGYYLGLKFLRKQKCETNLFNWLKSVGRAELVQSIHRSLQ